MVQILEVPHYVILDIDITYIHLVLAHAPSEQSFLDDCGHSLVWLDVRSDSIQT